MSREMSNSIVTRPLTDAELRRYGALFTGQAHLHDMVERHMGPPLPMIATAFVLVNFLTDLVYQWIDPRVRKL